MDSEEKKKKAPTTKKKTTEVKKEPVSKTVKKTSEAKTVKKETKVAPTKKAPAKKKSAEEKKPVTKEEKVIKPKTTKTVTKTTKPKTSTTKKKEVVKKEVVKKEKVKKEEPVIETIKINQAEVKEEIKDKIVVTEDKKEEKVSAELLEARKKRYIIEGIIIGALVLILLILLGNKTFFKTNYDNGNIELSLPRFTYYLKDKDNKVEFATLRKSENLKEYFAEYLEGFIFYSCEEGTNTFYYNPATTSLIKDITINKRFVVKYVEVTYENRSPEEVCGLR